MKKFLIGLVIVLVIVIVGLIFYRPNITPAPADDKTPVQISMTKTDWQNKLLEITNLVKATFPGEGIGEEGSRPLGIGKVFNFEGTNGALVDLGVGGASTNEVAIVMSIDGNLQVMGLPVDGQNRNNFLSGGSVTHSDIIDIDTDKLVIYFASWGALDAKTVNCDLKAYSWDKNNKVFVLDQANTQILRTDYCKTSQPQGDI
ncbi:MAG: hypothetical protein WCV68_01880 [Candidatus Paceibacterota bacterium]|jgi:hypothetical protein